jgi:glycosyltransferase involved in cell wall biosynthesis
MGKDGGRLGMILKGYPRISESFISSEILLLESLGIPVEIYSLRQPRESFSHEHVKKIKAGVTYIPEYILPGLKTLSRSNSKLFQKLGSKYVRCFARAAGRGLARRKPATIRHFLQAGHLVQAKLFDPNIRHIHAHFSHTPTSVAYFASELSGLPFSFTAHAKDIYTSEPEQLARKIHKAGFVVTCTRYNARYLSDVAGNGACQTPIHTIYHGIDTDYFSFVSPSEPSPPYRILSVGRIVPKKGYDDLLKALAILERSGLDFRFIHIGSGEFEGKIEQEALKLGLEGKVSFLGTLPHDQVISHYQHAHCFALACKTAKNGDRDGIPNVLVEAMASGLPVISTRTSAIPELIEDGISGTLVPPEDPAAMADAIKAVLFDAAGNRLRSARARKKVETEFDSRKCVLKLHALFRQALDGNENRPLLPQ